MQSHELFLKMGPELARDILMFFRENERSVYKSAVATLTQKRHLRPVFVEKKPVPEQVAWMIKELAGKRADDMAEQILQVWLLQARQQMLVQFLDAVGVPHDGKGAVEELPEELAADKVTAGVDALAGEFPAKEVAIYLHVFNSQRPGGWQAIADVLANDPRLAL